MRLSLLNKALSCNCKRSLLKQFNSGKYSEETGGLWSTSLNTLRFFGYKKKREDGGPIN